MLNTKKQTDSSASRKESKSTEENEQDTEPGKSDAGKPDPKSKGKGQKETTDTQSTLDKHLSAAKSVVSKECTEETLKAFIDKMDKMASQDYIESKFESIVEAKFDEILTKKMKQFSEEVKQQVKKGMESVKKSDLIALTTTHNETEKAIDSLKSKVSDMDTSLEKLKSENEKVMSEMNLMKEQLEMREAKILSQAEEINNLEQYTRKNSVRIYGIDDNDAKESAEETARIVVKFLSDKLKTHITTADIDAAHRMGKFQTDGNRPIICKFVSRFTKFKVSKARRLLRGSTAIVREDLTLKNATLLEKTSGHDSVKSAWSDEGRIIALLEDSRKIMVDRNTDLDAL